MGEPHIKLVEPDLSGGKIDKSKIDLIASSDAEELTISGLRQDTFEYLIEKYGTQFHTIHFDKCPLVEDLTPLEHLPNVSHITWFWNIKCSYLWNLGNNKSLQSLYIGNFQKISSISPLSKAKALNHLVIEGGLWQGTKIDSLEPLTNLGSL